MLCIDFLHNIAIHSQSKVTPIHVSCTELVQGTCTSVMCVCVSMCCLLIMDATHSFYRWISGNCSHTKLLMKIDDDTLLRTKQLPRLREMIHRFIDLGTPIYAGTLYYCYSYILTLYALF